ncbi:hypothetical protein D3C73_692660 [compost metagenome]
MPYDTATFVAIHSTNDTINSFIHTKVLMIARNDFCFTTCKETKVMDNIQQLFLVQ